MIASDFIFYKTKFHVFFFFSLLHLWLWLSSHPLGMPCFLFSCPHLCKLIEFSHIHKRWALQYYKCKTNTLLKTNPAVTFSRAVLLTTAYPNPDRVKCLSSMFSTLPVYTYFYLNICHNILKKSALLICLHYYTIRFLEPSLSSFFEDSSS